MDTHRGNKREGGKPFTMRVSHQQLVGVGTGSGPLYLQIYQHLRRLILDGAWGQGTRLPSSRRIAHDLGVSRNTALLAIDKLMADGWIVARPGSGVYVSSETPPARPLKLVDSASARSEGSSLPVPFEIAHAATDRRRNRSRARPGPALHPSAGCWWPH